VLSQQSKRENMKKSEYRYNKFVQHSSRATTVPRSLASKEEGRAVGKGGLFVPG
jgi:hypothetical protein